MQVFVSGVWKEEKALAFAAEGRRLGEMIALAGFDLACGPGTGVAKFVVEGYRTVEPRGSVRFYLPRPEEMDKIGEVVGSGADEIITTDFDYPMRNIFQVRCSDALFILSGGDGSLEEAIVALAEYRMPVAALQDSGTAARALEQLVVIYPEWGDLLLIHHDLDTLFGHLRRHLGK